MKRSVVDLLAEVEGFEWDDANIRKSLDKHNVTTTEAEQVFTNPPYVVYHDYKHSTQVNRYGILGVTNDSRKLAVIFTLRNKLVRVISARGFHQKELRKYQKKRKDE